MVMNRILISLGLRAAPIPPEPRDNLEPYCTQEILQERTAGLHFDGEASAIRKIGARYGADL